MFDKETLVITSTECSQWSNDLRTRAKELFEKEQLSNLEYEEYKMAVFVASILDEVAVEMVEETKAEVSESLN